jgi:hypothetical protein
MVSDGEIYAITSILDDIKRVQGENFLKDFRDKVIDEVLKLKFTQDMDWTTREVVDVEDIIKLKEKYKKGVE